MVLITCRECRRQVSSEATACPNCGAPPRPSSSVEPDRDGAYVTTQATSKRLKLQRLYSGLLLASGLGVVFVTMSDPGMQQELRGVSLAGAAAAFVGLVWYILTRMRIWWHHG